MILAFFFAIAIPLCFLLIFLEGEQRLIVSFLVWGVCAGALASYLNSSLVDLFATTTMVPSVTIAPVVEEFLKALPLFLILLLTGRRYDRSLLVLAMASGFGFAILENYVYITALSLTGAGPVLYALIRGITSSVMHGCMTAIIGYGIFLTSNLSKRSLPVLLFGLYTVSLTLHALYNLMIGYTGIGRVFAISAPLTLFILLLVAYNWGVLIGEGSGREG
ncbi:PrsW family glutamic-type intramembrane protease [Methanosphaerula subterraneus]|uniref:PrsW family glutamic-type intramembrane protease n=1 Tax=Methanosphaerula subterraneus TaxID=3350244 RepID=UPI003F864558